MHAYYIFTLTIAEEWKQRIAEVIIQANFFERDCSRR